ncbi:MAG: hypothetical protein SVV80_04410 [Planctomycetota bacterium]|nr:hypothetical protein [Planctomycetota bacterium]
MGNKLGWILAGIFGVVVTGVLVASLLFSSPTPPTRATLGKGMLTLQKPRQSLTLILPAEPAAEGNAADDYQRAWKLYDENTEALKDIFKHYNDVAKDKYRLTDDDVALLNRIAGPISAGAAKKEMTYYSPEKMEIPYWPAEANQFQSLVEVPQMLFVHYAGKGHQGYPAAEKCMFDTLAMANHLINERARVDIVRAGIGLQKSVCELLEQLYDRWEKPERIRAVREYRAGLRDISGIYTDLYAVIWKLERRQSGAFGPNPGDIFNLVENHADRAVRVEAILALGVVKLTCASKGDHRRARELINKKLAADDPIEQTAAKCADALDQEGFDRLVNAK